MLYSGCFVSGGSGTMLVTGVGNDTEFGQIAQELSSIEKTTTPLQEKLDRLGKGITILGSSLRHRVSDPDHPVRHDHTISLDTVSEAFITSIVLIVAAVPEGLPTIVAVSLCPQHHQNVPRKRSGQKDDRLRNHRLRQHHLFRQDRYPHREQNDRPENLRRRQPPGSRRPCLSCKNACGGFFAAEGSEDGTRGRHFGCCRCSFGFPGLFWTP